MMHLSGKRVTEICKHDTAKAVVAFRKALIEFGYVDLTAKEVEQCIKNLLEGKQKRASVIAIMINKWMTNGIDEQE